LHPGHLLERHLDPQIAAGDHESIRDLHDLVETRERLRFLELRHDERLAAGDLAHLRHVVRALHEGERDPIDPGIERRFQIGPVLFRHGGNGNRRVGQAHALAVRDLARDFDRGDGPALPDLLHPQAKPAVVDQDRVARLQRGQDLRVGQVHALGAALRIVGVEREGLAAFQQGTVPREGADAQLRALEIRQDGDRTPVLRLDRADDLNAVAQPVPRQMAHVEAEHVCAGLEELADHLGGAGGRPKGRDDLGAPRASYHVTAPPGGWCP
jgi:hypothetical protein